MAINDRRRLEVMWRHRILSKEYILYRARLFLLIILGDLQQFTMRTLLDDNREMNSTREKSDVLLLLRKSKFRMTLRSFYTTELNLRKSVSFSVFCVILLLICPYSPVLASGTFVGSAKIASRINDITIYWDDFVTDGCLSRPNVIRNAAELAFRKNNVEVIDNGYSKIFIEARGFRAKNKHGDFIGCITSVDITVIYATPVGPMLIYRFSDLMIGGDDKTDDIRSSVAEAIEDYVVNLYRKQREPG